MSNSNVSNTRQPSAPQKIEVNVYPFGGLLETLAFAKSLRPRRTNIIESAGFFFLVAEKIRPDIHLYTTLEDLMFWRWMELMFFQLEKSG